MLKPQFDRASAAACLRDQRTPISKQLACLVRDWPKYRERYAADPAAFAQLETDALVEYVALLLDTGEETFKQLYIGEKAKQLHDPAISASERRRRDAALLEAERRVFIEALSNEEASAFIDDAFDEIQQALLTDAKVEVKALFVGDCLFIDLISFITAPALADGVRLNSSFVTGHEPGEIAAAIGEYADEHFDVIFYSPFNYGFLDSYEALQRPLRVLRPWDGLALARKAASSAIDILNLLAGLFDCPIVAHAPAPVLRSEGTVRERASAAVTAPFRRAAITMLRKQLDDAKLRLAPHSVVHIIDERDVVREVGIAAAGQYFLKFAFQHPARLGALLASTYRDIFFVAGLMLKRKLIACDLDNTLWHGVIGEGLGIEHYTDRHAILKALKNRGVLLAINSKNDRDKVVWQAAEKQLSLEDFVAQEINWDPKHLNMRRIANDLNLKEKSFVFVDDRADERAMVEENLPEVLTLDATSPRSWRLLDLWGRLISNRSGSDRTDFYRKRKDRVTFLSQELEIKQADKEEAYARLQLRLAVRDAGPDDVQRVTELINRTNQFNTTAARTSRAQMEALVADDGARVLIADAADRFGSMGTISVLVVRDEGAALTIPFFVLSCRVFGYGMEFALLREAVRFGRAGQPVRAVVVETEFNQPCRGVFAAAGFSRLDNGWILEPESREKIAVPSWLTVSV